MYCCICGKKFDSNISFSNHKRSCLKCHIGKQYTCVCGKTFNTPAERSSHYKYCEEYCKINNKEVRQPKLDKGNHNRGWNRGLTKDDPIYGKTIERIAKANSERLKNLGDSHPLTIWNKNKPIESINRQSKTRKRKYLSGELVPAPRTGYSIPSIFVYKNKMYELRSTYELIYAIYLAINGKDFDYENIKVEYNDHVYFNDFYVDSTIVEIAYKEDEKHLLEEKAFLENGFKYKVLYFEDIDFIKKKLKNYLDIESILNEARIIWRSNKTALKIEYDSIHVYDSSLADS